MSKPYHQYYNEIQHTDKRKSIAVLKAYRKYRQETLLGRIAIRMDSLIDLLRRRS